MFLLWGVLAALGCATGGGGSMVAQNAASEPESYGHQLLRTKCQRCHRMPRPETMSGRKWRRAVERMHWSVTLPPADWDSLLALGQPDTTAPPRRDSMQLRN